MGQLISDNFVVQLFHKDLVALKRAGGYVVVWNIAVKVCQEAWMVLVYPGLCCHI